MGPLPAPSVLREYEDILPGTAERIMRVHESQTTQVAGREDRIVDAEILLNKRGQVWAGVLALVFAVAGIVFIARGNNIGGGIMFSMPVSMLVVSFLPARLRRRGDTLDTGSTAGVPESEPPG